MTPIQLESDILIWLSEHSEDPLVALQAESAKVSNREYTGAGFWVKLEIPDDVERLPDDSGKDAPISGPYIDSDNLAHGGGTIFIVEGGAISRLEIFAYGSSFPERLIDYKLRYIEQITPDELLLQPDSEKKTPNT